MGGVDHHLAELNVARLREPLDHADTAEFVRVLEPINAVAEATPGFIWRLTDDDGSSSSYVELPGNDDPLPVSYTHLRAHETVLDLVCRLLLEKNNKKKQTTHTNKYKLPH